MILVFLYIGHGEAGEMVLTGHVLALCGLAGTFVNGMVGATNTKNLNFTKCLNFFSFSIRWLTG